jgi:hypothetical protein
MPHHRPRVALVCQQATVLAAVAAVGLSATGVMRLDVVPPSGPASPGGSQDGASLVSAAPVEPEVRSVPLDGAAAAASRLPRAAGGPSRNADQERRVKVVSPSERAPGYATVGVTWDADQKVTEETTEISVRTRTDGAWSAWQEMHLYPDHGPDPQEAAHDVRGGTDAVVVGDVDRVMVRVVGQGRTPDGLRLELIDPGDEGATTMAGPAIDTAATGVPEAQADEGQEAALSSTVSEPETAEPASMAAPRPQIFSRQQWGADESLRDRGSLRYGDIQGGFVHHTVNANGYTQDQVPSLLRGIYAYHTRSRGWSDVGYNFLVDRFGRIWEGRAGGVERPVVGAHTLGYNEHSFAMSAIGNFETVQPPQVMLDAYARLFAWKLSLHGVRADAPSVRIGSRSFAAISGHRDAGSTACPGRYLYAKLGGIRTAAAALQQKPRVSSPEHNANISGTKWPDFVARDRQTGRASVVRTGGQVAFLEPTKAATGLGDVDLVAAPGDVDGDGSADLVARSRSTGKATLYRGSAANGRVTAARTYGKMAGLDQLAAGGDLDGDGHVDLVGRNKSRKALRYYPGRGDGRFAKAKRLSADWSAYDLTAGVGDLDGDGLADLVARSGSKLLLFPGNGRGGLRSPVVIPGDWSGLDLLAGRGDITGDGVPDLVGRERAGGTTHFYPGDGKGGLGPRLGGTQRYAGQRWLALGGQMVGSGAHDLVALNEAGAVRVFRNSGGTNIAKVVDTGVDLSDADLVLSVGDWNGDKHGDFMARRGGEMSFYAGNGKDGFAPPVSAGQGWAQLTHVAAVGDANGDGSPDLVGRTKDGAIRVYPGNGKSGFKPSYSAKSSDATSALAGVGHWYGDGSPAVVLRRSGALWLHRTNQAGELTSRTQVGKKAGRYDQVMGLGDLDGAGKADLLVRQKATGDLWMLRGTASGFTTPGRFVAGGFARYDLMG